MNGCGENNDCFWMIDSSLDGSCTNISDIKECDDIKNSLTCNSANQIVFPQLGKNRGEVYMNNPCVWAKRDIEIETKGSCIDKNSSPLKNCSQCIDKNTCENQSENGVSCIWDANSSEFEFCRSPIYCTDYTLKTIVY